MMAPASHPRPSPPSDTNARDRELDAWLEKAFGLHRADPEPVVHDLD